MANAAEMTTIISEATGVEKASVAWVVRVLREAGLLTSGGRGRNAPAMTTLDAARALIALLVTDHPTDAAMVVRDFGSMRRNVFTPKIESDVNIDVMPGQNELFEVFLSKALSSSDENLFDGLSVEVELNNVICEVSTAAYSCNFLHDAWNDFEGNRLQLDALQKLNDFAETYGKTQFVTKRGVYGSTLRPIAAMFREAP